MKWVCFLIAWSNTRSNANDRFIVKNKLLCLVKIVSQFIRPWNINLFLRGRHIFASYLTVILEFLFYKNHISLSRIYPEFCHNCYEIISESCKPLSIKKGEECFLRNEWIIIVQKKENAKQYILIMYGYLNEIMNTPCSWLKQYFDISEKKER